MYLYNVTKLFLKIFYIKKLIIVMKNMVMLKIIGTFNCKLYTFKSVPINLFFTVKKYKKM